MKWFNIEIILSFYFSWQLVACAFKKCCFSVDLVLTEAIVFASSANCFYRGAVKKKRIRAFSLKNIPIKSPATFIPLFKCSRAWPDSIAQKGTCVLLTTQLPFWNSSQISGSVCFNAFISTRYNLSYAKEYFL